MIAGELCVCEMVEKDVIKLKSNCFRRNVHSISILSQNAVLISQLLNGAEPNESLKEYSRALLPNILQ